MGSLMADNWENQKTNTVPPNIPRDNDVFYTDCCYAAFVFIYSSFYKDVLRF